MQRRPRHPFARHLEPTDGIAMLQYLVAMVLTLLALTIMPGLLG